MVGLAERCRCVEYLKERYAVSERRGCQAMNVHRSSYRYAGIDRMQGEVYQKVIALSKRYPYWGYRKIYDLMKQQNDAISRESVRCIRRTEGLQVVQKAKKRRLLGTTTQWVHQAHYPNHVWSYDFVFDQTMESRTLKCLTVVDEFTRRAMTIEVQRSITASDVTVILEKLFKTHGSPACIRSDNGPELVAKKVQKWLHGQHIKTHYIQPGSPWENAYNESFNSIFRLTCLNRWLFASMMEARVIVNQWLEEYNTVRPHGSLKGQSPSQFLRNWLDTNTNQQPKILTL